MAGPAQPPFDADAEVRAIKDKRDHGNLKGAMDEVRQDWGKLTTPADQDAFRDKMKAAGVLPDIALQYTKEALDQSYSHTDSHDGIHTRAQIALGAGDTLGATMFGEIDQNWNNYAPKSGKDVSRIISEGGIDNTLAQHQADHVSEEFGRILGNKDFYGKIQEGTRGNGKGGHWTSTEVTPDSIKKALPGLTGDDKTNAQYLLDNWDNKGARAVQESGFTGWVSGHHINPDTVAAYLKDHPTPEAPPPPASPPPPAALQPAQVSKAPPDTKLTLHTKDHNSLWSMAYEQVKGHPYKKGDHWSNADNVEILKITALLQAAHKGVVRKDRDEDIEITYTPPAPAPTPQA